MADEETPETTGPDFPTGRVKKIMKLDKEIDKVNSEALFLVTCATQHFLEFLAERSAEVAKEKKRKTVKLEHMRLAVKRHRQTSDFLLDSLPVPSESLDLQAADKSRSLAVADKPKPVPAGTRRIDQFFSKPVSDAST
ncbi:hypothetical protein CDL15_Pgr024509 [Punica granatum]|uniref:Transcription factor CBF/NF-Y/archaeal histone domain-containing protein n=1 Tax=Punica granatum TaxID=22663 RepID=A0A218XZ13_PUNGR|nr:hypothetical protein CDL15_Pgr024509 [Punica granatum]